MVMVPVRAALVGLGSATMVTSLVPPLPLEEMWSQLVVVELPQAQTPGATTLAVPVPPL